MKKISFLSLIFIALFAIVSCGDKKDKQDANSVKFSNDMENNLQWMNTNTLVKDKAHSGDYVCKMDSTHEYSFGFYYKFEKMNTKLPKKAKVNLFAFAQSSCEKVQLAIEVDSLGKTIFWTSKPIEKKLSTPNQWIEVAEEFDFPQNILPSYDVKVYVWNPKKKNFLLDDLNVEFTY